jgi:hypothetical protein
MTPEKMLDIHERMIDLRGKLQAEFGGRIGLVLSGNTGENPFGFPVGPGPMPSTFSVTFVFSGDEKSQESAVPPPFMSTFDGGGR